MAYAVFFSTISSLFMIIIVYVSLFKFLLLSIIFLSYYYSFIVNEFHFTSNFKLLYLVIFIMKLVLNSSFNYFLIDLSNMLIKDNYL